MKGVYVIHDQETGEPYVGAAYADEGIWHRLSAYAETLRMEKEPHHRRPALGPIPVCGLLNHPDPAMCKLHCAVWNQRDHPIDVLASDWDEWVGWSRWRGAPLLVRGLRGSLCRVVLTLGLT